MKELDVGKAKLTIINLGDLKFTLEDTLAVPESAWRPRYGGLFEIRLSFPSQSVHVSIEGESILVDAGEYSKFAAVGSEYVEKGYRPPPGLVEQLPITQCEQLLP